MPVVTSLVSRFNRSNQARRREVRVWGGRFSGTSFDRLLYLYLHKGHVLGRHERALLERHIKPGMTVLDVGANLGLYTYTLSRLVGDAGQVCAFEPEPALFQCLERNCAANGLRNVRLFNAAVGDASGTATISHSPVNSGDNRVWGDAAGTGPSVRIVTLDEALGATRPDFIKMDVQGYELKALRGMTRILRDTPRLMVYLEFWPFGLRSVGDDPSSLLDLLTAESFALYSDDGVEKPIRDTAAFCAQLNGKAYGHVLAVRS
jgi:FkbM family methyltransferase